VRESQNQPFQLSFNKLLRVDFQGSRVTSDSGLILVRELDERFGLSDLIGQHLVDFRRGRNRQFPLADLLRQSVYSRLAGYEDLNDAARLSADPTFRLLGSEKVWERGVALTCKLHWFETDLLARKENLTGLATLNRELVAQAEGVGSPHRLVLDMDSSESPVYGEQEQSAYNGYLGSVCYHPLFLFNSQGDSLVAKLRPGKKAVYLELGNLFSLRPDLTFYDITSTYFEGAGPAELGRFGYSRDGRPRNRQIVIGMVMMDGWPIASCLCWQSSGPDHGDRSGAGFERAIRVEPRGS